MPTFTAKRPEPSAAPATEQGSEAYGPLAPLMADPQVSEVMVNGHNEVFVERQGLLQRTAVQFRDAGHLHEYLSRLVAAVGRRVDHASPLVDARLADGSRLNAVVAPLVAGGPVLTIRKFQHRRPDLPALVTGGSLAPAAASYLKECVQAGANILVAGAAGAGKTTLLNALAGLIAPDQRVIAVEDCAELAPACAHVVCLESRPANGDGRGTVDLRTLLRNALRMRPDRLLIGEVRGPEAFDLIQAMHTGHPAMATIHARSAQDALYRLETMALLAESGLSLAAARELVGHSVELVVHQVRLPSGRRVVREVATVVGRGRRHWQLQPVFGRLDGGAPPALPPTARLRIMGHGAPRS